MKGKLSCAQTLRQLHALLTKKPRKSHEKVTRKNVTSNEKSSEFRDVLV